MRKPATPSQPAPTRASVSPVWLGLLLTMVTIVAFHPAWHGGFIWDDELNVVHNRLLVEPDGLKRIWFSLEAPQYYPLTYTTFYLERRLWGLHPAGYHFVNLCLHSACALLLWRLLRRLRVPGAGLAAAVFALHPVNVESVAWITERKNILSLFFFLLSLLLYLRSDEPSKVQSLKSRGGSQPPASSDTHDATGNTQHATRFPFHAPLPPPSSLCYGLSLLAFALALLSKTAVAPLPVVLLLVAWWRQGRVAGRDVWRTVPFFTAALLLIPLTMAFEFEGGAEIVRSDNFWSRLTGAGWAFWFYLYKAVLPLNLIFIYPRWRIAPAHLLSYVPALLVVLGFGVCWRYRQGWGKAGLFGLGYFVVMLLPVLGFIDIYFMRFSLVADHWQYFAIIGPIALVAAALTAAGERLGRGKAGLGVAVGGALLLVLGVLTWKQAAIYADEETVWRDTLAKNPACWLAHGDLGIALGMKGQTDEAISQYQQALRLKPDYAEAYNNLGIAFYQQGRADEAILQFQEAIRLTPDYADAHDNLGNALAQKGQIDEAITQYQQALRLKPDDADAHNNLGNALGQKGQLDDAIRQFQQALRLKPDYADAHDNLGNALGQKGQTDDAIRQFQQALRLRPNDAGACYNLALALASKGQLDDAIRQFQETIRLKPDYADAHNNLGAALAANGQIAEAISQFQEALRLKPDYAGAYYNLGNALASKGQLDDAIRQFQQAIRLKPDYADALNNLGNALAAQGQTDDAIRQFQESIRLRPNDAGAYNGLGIALARKGQLDDAIRQFQEAIRLKPDYAEARNNLARALRTNTPPPDR